MTKSIPNTTLKSIRLRDNGAYRADKAVRSLRNTQAFVFKEDIVMDIKEIGRLGEDMVADYLRKKGCIIVKQNYRTRFGEIDVIAEDKEHIIFTEVKTRSENYAVSGAEAVDSGKRRRILLAALDFNRKLKVELQPRFDVAEVTVSERTDGTKSFSLNYIKDAF